MEDVEDGQDDATEQMRKRPRDICEEVMKQGAQIVAAHVERIKDVHQRLALGSEKPLQVTCPSQGKVTDRWLFKARHAKQMVYNLHNTLSS